MTSNRCSLISTPSTLRFKWQCCMALERSPTGATDHKRANSAPQPPTRSTVSLVSSPVQLHNLKLHRGIFGG